MTWAILFRFCMSMALLVATVACALGSMWVLLVHDDWRALWLLGAGHSFLWCQKTIA